MKEVPQADSPVGNRLEVVDCLRGVAVLLVCFLHFTVGANNSFEAESIIRRLGSYGWLGVEMFFVISGFIIPYSLHRAGYQPRNYPTFLLKRVLRLDPPYLFAVLLIIGLNYLVTLAPSFQGEPFKFSLPQALLHLAYLNTFFDYGWLNPVFWTLAIEFQYYLAVGLLFPLLAHKSPSVRSGLYVGLGLLACLLPEERFLCHWLFLFMLGMQVFQWRVALSSRRSFGLGLALLSMGAWFTLGPLIAVVGVGTALVIALVRYQHPALLFLGAISFSLYLVHVPIGVKVMNLGARYVHGTFGNLVLVALALALSILGAYALYIWVEKPAQRWSSAMKYGKPASSA